MSRLLFAAARGARIQFYVVGGWSKSEMLWLENCPYDFRIHPEDQNLQYGPISSALRVVAETDEWREDVHIGEWSCPILTSIMELQMAYHCDNELHRSLFLLFLAEALADEGL